jgi:putative addiction module component (TIGR02574 family)
MATLTKSEIAALSIDERFALVDDIWDSFGESQEALSPPDWHREVVERRLAAAELNPRPLMSWEEVRTKMVKKRLS